MITLTSNQGSVLEALSNVRVAVAGVGAKEFSGFGIGSGTQGVLRRAEDLTVTNLDSFLDGLDLVVDGLNMANLDAKRELHTRARQAGIPVILCLPVGSGVAAYVFGSKSPTFEDFFAVPSGPELRRTWVPPGTLLLPELPGGTTDQRRTNRRNLFAALSGERPTAGNALSTFSGNLLLHYVLSALVATGVPEVPSMLFLDADTHTMVSVNLEHAVKEQRDSIWTLMSPSYDAVLMPGGRSVTVYGEVLKQVVADLGGCHRVLEGGVGTGMIAERLARQGVEVYGIDKNVAMLGYALQRAAVLRQEGAGRLYVGEGDVEELFFEDESFDGYLSNNVVFDADIEKSLREAHRVLKPGGLLVINSLMVVPDIQKLGGTDYLVSLGVERSLADAFIQCQLHMYEGRILKHGFQTHGLQKVVDLLLGIGFSDVLRTDTTYRGQSCYVLARR